MVKIAVKARDHRMSLSLPRWQYLVHKCMRWDSWIYKGRSSERVWILLFQLVSNWLLAILPSYTYVTCCWLNTRKPLCFIKKEVKKIAFRISSKLATQIIWLNNYLVLKNVNKIILLFNINLLIGRSCHFL